MTGKREGTRPAVSGYCASVGGWPKSPIEGAKRRLDVETRRFQFDDGRMLRRRPTSGSRTATAGSGAAATISHDAQSRIRQRDGGGVARVGDPRSSRLPIRRRNHAVRTRIWEKAWKDAMVRTYPSHFREGSCIAINSQLNFATERTKPPKRRNLTALPS